MEVSKYPHHMVLISENFVEARQLLSHTTGGPSAVVLPVAAPKAEASSATSLPVAPQGPTVTVRTPGWCLPFEIFGVAIQNILFVRRFLRRKK